MYSQLLGIIIRFLKSLTCPLQGVISGAIGMSLQWIMKYPNANPADMKSTTLLTPDVDYEFACFAKRYRQLAASMMHATCGSSRGP